MPSHYVEFMLTTCDKQVEFSLKNAVGLAISRFLGDNPTFHRQFSSHPNGAAKTAGVVQLQGA
jgi:hypothetical protein